MKLNELNVNGTVQAPRGAVPATELVPVSPSAATGERLRSLPLARQELT